MDWLLSLFVLVLVIVCVLSLVVLYVYRVWGEIQQLRKFVAESVLREDWNKFLAVLEQRGFTSKIAEQSQNSM